MQNIVYDEYLPLLLGSTFMNALGLNLDRDSSYKDNLDASLFNEFSSAALRFGHSTVSGLFKPIGHRNWPLKFHYFDFREFVLGDQGSAFEHELHGLASQPSQRADLVATDDMTDFLMFDKTKSKVGDDIMARNIQRGRDHGIPTYNTMRQACGLQALSSFRVTPREIGSSDWRAMAGVYDDVEDIDLVTGGLAEAPVSGGLIGPTLACIISQQFHALMMGDRYFFTHSSGSNHRYDHHHKPLSNLKLFRGLPEPLMKEIRKRTLRDILCENTDDIRSLQRSVLKQSSRSNPLVSCSRVNEIDFDVVKDNLADKSISAIEEEEDPTTSTTTTEPTTTTKTTTTKENKPKPIPKPKPKPIPKPPGPCVDKLSFCQWKIPECATNEKIKKNCCKTCGGRHG